MLFLYGLTDIKDFSFACAVNKMHKVKELFLPRIMILSATLRQEQQQRL
jgi:hypothetical protein